MKKKILYGSIILSALVFLFGACKKTDDSSSIVGSWELSTAQVITSYTSSQTAATTADTSYSSGYSKVLTFNIDSSFTEVNSLVTPHITTNGYYSLFAGNFALKQNAIVAIDTAAYSISKNVLVTKETTVEPLGNGQSKTIITSENWNRK